MGYVFIGMFISIPTISVGNLILHLKKEEKTLEKLKQNVRNNGYELKDKFCL